MTAHRYPGGIISASAPTVTSNSAVGVWTVEEAVRYKAAGTWPDGTGTDPYFNYTTLLLHGDGTNGAQNNTFLDGSTNNFTITRNGNTTQGSATPYVGPGNWGVYFNGTTDYLTLPSGVGFNFGTSDLTIEAWVYPTARVTNGAYILGQSSYGAGTDYLFSINNSGTLQFYMTTGGANIVTSSGTIPLNTWTHVAVSRSGTSFKLFINGAVDGTITSSVSITNSYTPATIGNSTNNTGSVYFPGYISNLRVVKGTAIYTAAFTTPTTPLVATTQTTLLTCNNNGFNDLSGANYTITRNGSAQVSKFSPFTLYQTNPASYSGYFDGTGDYLSLSTATAFGVGTGDFTIEYWAFYNTFASSPIGFDTRSTSGDTTPSDYVTTGGNLVFYYNSANLLTSTNAAVLGRWNHIAWVRSGTTLTSYINGVASGSVTSSANFGTTQPLRIAGNITAANFLNGSISNFRFVKGTAVYTTGFTPPTAPLTAISGTSLLTCQSTTFIDNSTNAFTITANGNATPKRANPFTDTVTGPTPYATTTYGGSSYFDGTGDYLSVSSFTDAQKSWWTGNYTIEYWIYPTALTETSSASVVVGNMVGNAGGNYWSFGPMSNGTVKFYYYTGVSQSFSTTATISINQWSHLAFVKNGTALQIYINGALLASSTVSGTPQIGSTTPITIGSSNNVAQAGYISNLRIAQTALYTAPFVPPTAPVTAVTNTLLLVNATNAGIFDNTTVNDLETVGSAQVSTSVVKYGTGSMSFNGLNSYLYAINNTALQFATGDYTVEFWVYASSFSATPVFTDFRTSNGATGGAIQISATTGGVINVYGGSSTATLLVTAGSALTTSTWYHVALTRASGATRLFINGTQSGSTYASDTTSYNLGALWIGSNASGGANYLNGYLDDVRVTKGVARYTANFTPPAGAFPNV